MRQEGGELRMQKNSEELVSRLSYEIVKEAAPDELDLFDDFKEAFLKNPNALLGKDPQKREEMLGFALPPGTEQFVTIFVLPVVFGIIERYVSKRMGGKLGGNKINKMRDEAYNNAISLGMDKEKAELMADSLIGKLVQLGFK